MWGRSNKNLWYVWHHVQGLQCLCKVCMFYCAFCLEHHSLIKIPAWAIFQQLFKLTIKKAFGFVQFRPFAMLHRKYRLIYRRHILLYMWLLVQLYFNLPVGILIDQCCQKSIYWQHNLIPVLLPSDGCRWLRFLPWLV